MTAFFKTTIAALLLLAVHGACAEDPKPILPKRLEAEFQALFRRHYPKATMRTNDYRIVFEHNTQLFQVPRAGGGKAGGLPPLEQRGPKRGGILCDLVYVKGAYNGQLSVYKGGTLVEFPNFKDFKCLVMAERSAKQDGHLYLHLYYPPGTDSKFLTEFKRLAMDFDKYLD